jgi:hypothetical protein
MVTAVVATALAAPGGAGPGRLSPRTRQDRLHSYSVVP